MPLIVVDVTYDDECPNAAAARAAREGARRPEPRAAGEHTKLIRGAPARLTPRPGGIRRTAALASLLTLTACAPDAASTTSPYDLPTEHLLPGEDGYRLVVEGLVQASTLRVVGPAWDDVWIRGCRISGAAGDGIFIRDVTRLKVSGCEIDKAGGQGGIRLSATGGSDDVLLEGNHIHDVAENGINAAQRSEAGVHHVGLRILDNRIERTGLEGHGGLTHGLYIQSRDVWIEGNTLIDVRDGNGISVRSAGVVRGNEVSGFGQSGVRYYGDHDGGGGTLRIENNLVAGDGTGAAIDARRAPDVPSEFSISSLIVRFNTALAASDRAAFSFDGALAPTTDLILEGNLLLGAAPVHGASLGDNAHGQEADVLSTAQPFDLHLAAPHSSRGSWEALAAPAEDIDGDLRPATGRDPGADQYVDEGFAPAPR